MLIIATGSFNFTALLPSVDNIQPITVMNRAETDKIENLCKNYQTSWIRIAPNRTSSPTGNSRMPGIAITIRDTTTCKIANFAAA